MFVHIDFLIMLICLLVGAWSATCFHHKARRFVDRSLSFLFWAVLLANALLLRTLFLRYARENRLLDPICDFIDRWMWVEMIVRTMAILASLLLLISAISMLHKSRLPRWLGPVVTGGTFVFYGLYQWAFHFPGWSPWKLNYLVFWHPYRLFPVLIAAGWVVVLLRRHSAAGGRPDSLPARHLGHCFLFYAFLITLSGLLFLLGFERAADIADRLATAFLSLSSLHWLLRCYIPGHDNLSQIITRNLAMDTVQTQFSLSKREYEILLLMLDGKSYKEIELQLFISLHTVKRHVYNLYRKMKINSRHQLIHLISQLQEEGRTDKV